MLSVRQSNNVETAAPNAVGKVLWARAINGALLDQQVMGAVVRAQDNHQTLSDVDRDDRPVDFMPFLEGPPLVLAGNLM
jgi:hypothetical protein